MTGGPFIQFVEPNHTLQIAGVKMLGADASDGRKRVLTIIFSLVLYAIRWIFRVVANRFGGDGQTTAFWARWGINLTIFWLGVVGFHSIWFSNPACVATGIGLLGAGLAFALQKVVTSFADYFVILRGKTFDFGDRIRTGGVRGDVIALNFIQTVIMEMGEPPSVQGQNPGCGCRAARAPEHLGVALRYSHPWENQMKRGYA